MKKLLSMSLLIFFMDTMTGWADTQIVTSTSTAGWNTDRYTPKVFTYVDDHSNLGISSDDADGNRPTTPVDYSSTFFRLQGMFHSAASEGFGWKVSTGFKVTSNMLTTGLWRSDIWARTGLNGVDDATSDYPIMGFKRFDPTNAFDKLASNITPNWRVWDLAIGDWFYPAVAPTVGVHDLEIEGTATSYIYRIDGDVVFETTTVKNPLFLDTVFLEGFNLFNAAEDFGQMNTFEYSDVTFPVAVPEPSTTLLIFGACVFSAFRRRRVSFGLPSCI